MLLVALVAVVGLAKVESAGIEQAVAAIGAPSSIIRCMPTKARLAVEPRFPNSWVTRATEDRAGGATTTSVIPGSDEFATRACSLSVTAARMPIDVRGRMRPVILNAPRIVFVEG